jgi:AcrR family transcriptional regulator
MTDQETTETMDRTSGTGAPADEAQPQSSGADAAGGGDAAPVTDGRRLRAARNRELVIDAILDLFDEGVLDFDAALVAERAGVSQRSVYRYFQDRQALVLEGVARHGERVSELLDLPLDSTGALDDRIRAFVAYRLDLYRRVEGVVLVARHHGARLPAVADTLEARRAMARTQLSEVFGRELATLRGGRRSELLAALDAATDFDTWRLLRDAHELGSPAIERVMSDLLHRLLGPLAGGGA